MRISHSMYCAIVAVLAVPGCTGTAADQASFEELDDAGAALAEIIDNIDYTDPSDLPTIGQVSYSGYARAATPLNEFAGELTLVADFDPQADAITGSIDNIRCNDGCTYEGSIAISNGEIDRFGDPEVDYTFRADMAGDITLPGDGTYTVAGEMLGDFSGGDFRYVDGEIGGDITGVAGTIPFEGAFVGIAD